MPENIQKFDRIDALGTVTDIGISQNTDKTLGKD
jgi:hypothetical protein